MERKKENLPMLRLTLFVAMLTLIFAAMPFIAPLKLAGAAVPIYHR